MKKFLSIFLTVALMFSATACAQKPSEPVNTTENASSSTDKATETAKATEATKVKFWYLWGGDEGKIIEDIIASYNKSQDKYIVEGLSVPDQQKIIVSISGGNGPDISDGFGNDVFKFAKEGLSEPLDAMIDAEKFDTSIFVDNALEQQKYEGKLYALPLSLNAFALYYNKDVLKELGYSEPPKTLEELKKIALEATKVENGVVTRMGGMFIPSEQWAFSWANAYGTNFGSIDAKEFNPKNEGFLDALKYTEDIVKITGSAPLNTFVTSGNSNYGNPQDPFVSGTQLFRVDGPWYYNIAKSANPNLNFGIAPFPGSEKTGSSGYSILETSNMFIPSTAKNKEGAWDFMKYITTGEGSKMFVMKKGDLAPTKALLDDEEVIKSNEHFPVFFDIIKGGKLLSMPMYENTTDYQTAVFNTAVSIIQGKSEAEAIADYDKTISSIAPKK